MDTNISLYTVPAAWLLAMIPRVYSLATYKAHSKAGKELEHRNPRSMPSQINADPTLTPQIRDRIIRAESAQLNGFENLGFFAAAVVAGNIARVSPTLLNGLSVGYLASRTLYNYIFIIVNDTERFVPARTATFVVGVGINWTLFILSGMKLQYQ